jgi:hypothetical protein
MWEGNTGTNIVVKDLPVTATSGSKKNYNKFEEIEIM